MTTYTAGFKGRMVQRMAGREAISATALAQEVGVSQNTLSRWLRQASHATPTVAGMKKKHASRKSPARRTAAEKLDVVMRAAALSDDDLGAFLRREGLHEALLEEWRSKAMEAATGALKAPHGKRNQQTPERRKIRELERELRRKNDALAEAGALLLLKKRLRADVGGRGRRFGHEERDMILGLIDEAVASGARQSRACDVIGLAPRTLQRWRAQGIGDDGRAGPKHPPQNKLSAKERARVLEIANTAQHRDLSPKQIVPMLADEGIYIASESTFYRILREEKQLVHRAPSRPSTKRHRPEEYVATGPNQVWSWDITYLRGPVRGMFFYFYVVIDVWSRKLVGSTLEVEESAEHAEAMFDAACKREGVRRDQLVIHSDNGGPMKAATLLAFLQSLGIVSSFSRPSVSNDNPYSEALFRTAKYRVQYPRTAFESVEAARRWARWFVAWYNTEHRHSAIKFVTPHERHAGEDLAILAARAALYEAARAKNPKRWTKGTRDWSPVETVVLNPALNTEKAAADAA
ncbi:MAG: IS3 family transposase [bacterium]|nr:IS3 family transposase [bacterium]